MLSFLSLSAAAGGLDFMPQPGPFLAGIWLNKPFIWLNKPFKRKALGPEIFLFNTREDGRLKAMGEDVCQGEGKAMQRPRGRCLL